MYVSDEVMQNLDMKGEYSVKDTSRGKLFYCSYSFSKTGWDYVTAVPYDNIFQTVNQALKTSLSVLICVVILMLLAGTKMTASIIRHIEKLIIQCDVFGKGEYKPGSEIYEMYRSRRDEIGKLYRHFDRMARENGKMIQENYVKQQLLLETQVSKLQAQIRPHFIYNTLESVYCLAETNGDRRIAIMTAALGKLLRATLKEQRNVISLKEDMDIAESYLKIQSVRLEERLQVTVQIEEVYQDIRIPAMTIQPIVENAILHAAEEMLELCEIAIYGRERDGFFELVVEDNGPGIDVDIIKKLETKEVMPKGLGIGLTNINKRLKILISEKSGIVIERDEDRSRVMIRLCL